MGLSGISIWQLVIILAIVIMVFGTKRLGSLGSDLGSAVKGFKKAFNDDPAEQDTENEAQKIKEETSTADISTAETKQKID